jgi:hypothetical protein
VRSYQVWPDLDRVTVPVGIAYAPSDALHGVEAIERMRDALADARTYECPSNLYLHRAAVIAELDRFLGSVDGAAG